MDEGFKKAIKQIKGESRGTNLKMNLQFQERNQKHRCSHFSDEDYI